MQTSSAVNALSTASDYDRGGVLVSANLEILDQLLIALKNVEDEVYVHKINAQTSSIGMHIRHIIEFYQAFFKTLEDANSNDFCYDNRQRNMALETSRESATCALETIKHKFVLLTPRDCDMTLSVIIDPAQPLVSVPTSIYREFYHVLDHMVHHMALIKMIAEKQGIQLDENFGLAKATQAYQGKTK